MTRQSKSILTKQTAVLIILIIAVFSSVAYIQKDAIFQLIGRATGTEANLVIDVESNLGPVRPMWQYLAQGGEDTTTDMIAPVINQVKTLSAKRIRIDHIYNGYDVVSKDASGNISFNWTRLDAVVNSIRATGATPFLSLSYMPPAISSGDVIDKPTNWNDWAYVVQKTIEHYSRDLAIPNIAYEVWNEPDLFGDWKTYGDKNYLELYRWASIGANNTRGALAFELGGPATTKSYPAWIEAFLTFARDNNLRLDFISWHHYAFDMDDYAENISIITSELGRHPLYSGQVKVYLTETGPDSDINPVYDGAFGAAHLIALVRTTIDRISELYTFEITDGLDPAGQTYWGRWGIMTHPILGAALKPRYRALQLLNNLSGTRLSVTGEGTWVNALASQSVDGTIHVIIVNYDPVGTHSETAPIAINNLVPGNYTITQQTFGGGSTSQDITVSESQPYTATLTLPANGIAHFTISEL